MERVIEELRKRQLAPPPPSVTVSSQEMQQAVDIPVPEALQGLPEHIVRSVPHSKLLRQIPFFKCPEWAAVPSAYPGVHLEVDRAGVRLAPIMLGTLPFYLFGKSASVCDVTVEHPSTSRVHCVFVHHRNGQIFVVDLDSTHGTHLRGARIKPNHFEKVDWGDEVRIGQGTRRYILRKDPPTKRGNAERPQPPKATHEGEKALTAPSPAAKEESVLVAQTPVNERRRFRHILIKHKDVEKPVSLAPRNKKEPVTRSLADALALAKSLRAAPDIESEAGFCKLVENFSECATAKLHGDLGIVAQGDFVEEFEAAAFALSIGEVSQPVVTILGVHIIMRVSIEAPLLAAAPGA